MVFSFKYSDVLALPNEVWGFLFGLIPQVYADIR